MERRQPTAIGSTGRLSRALARSLVALITAITAVVVAAPGAAQVADGPQTFDFEDVEARISGRPATAPVVDVYADRGLVFAGNGVTALVYDDTSFPPRPDLPRSGSQVITTCYSAEFCSTRISMRFDPPLERVELFAGYAGRLTAPADVVLEAVGADGSVLGQATVTFPAVDQALPATNALVVTDDEGGIVGAQLRFVDESRFLNSLVADDLTIAPFVAVTEAELRPERLPIDLTDDGVVEELTLVNTGNQPLVDLTVAIDSAAPAVAAMEAELDAGCAPALAPGDGCVVGLRARPGVDGRVDVGLGVAEGGVLLDRAVIELTVTRTPTTTGTTATTATTAAPDDQDGADQDGDVEAEVATEPSTTAAPDDGGADEEDGDPEEDGLPPWLAYVLGGGILATGVRRWWRRRQRPPAPPEPDGGPPSDRPPRPAVDITVRPDPGSSSIEVDGDLALVASTGLGRAEIAITEEGGVDAAADERNRR